MNVLYRVYVTPLDMNFNELKEIIKHLRKVVPCNSCERKFETEGIQVLSTYADEGLFYFTCSNCLNQLIIHVSIVDHDEKEKSLNIQASTAPEVSKNDVLDIHNFLAGFNGDFKNLFSETY